MNPKVVELALKKQRLQLQAAAQRVMILQALESATPAFGAAEKVRSGWRWAKAHPEWLAGIGVALLGGATAALVQAVFGEFDSAAGNAVSNAEAPRWVIIAFALGALVLVLAASGAITSSVT